VEVELELEKQLALAHELFPANFRKVNLLWKWLRKETECRFLEILLPNPTLRLERGRDTSQIV
jgi:hypothetical protein